jgi:hypothetical protein
LRAHPATSSYPASDPLPDAPNADSPPAVAPSDGPGPLPDPRTSPSTDEGLLADPRLPDHLRNRHPRRHANGCDIVAMKAEFSRVMEHQDRPRSARKAFLREPGGYDSSELDDIDRS